MSELAAAPPDALFEELRARLTQAGPAAAADELAAGLRRKGDYGSLFYALLLKKRIELGVSPIPTGPAQELPEAVHAEYEEAIRVAARAVGRLFLERGDLPQAWRYYGMIGEPGPVVEALEAYRPTEDEDCQPVVEIAFQHGVHPRRGFDLVLERYGICTAITMASSYEFPHGQDVRAYCVQRLVGALYEQLCDRLRADIVRHDGEAPPPGLALRDLIAGRDWLFADDSYHIDVSHLSAVVQMSTQLPPGPELDLARQLCLYGQKLGAQYQYATDPPFDHLYCDVAVYLDVLAGERVEEGLAHFRAKLPDPSDETGSTHPAEVFVNLLLRLGRTDEALAVARQHLRTADDRQLSCPGPYELAQRAHNYRALADVAHERSDAVHFLAGLIAADAKDSRGA